MTKATPVVELTEGEIEKQPTAIDQLPKWSGKGRPPAAVMKNIREKKLAFYKSKKKGKEIIKAVSKLDLFLEEFIRNGGNATEAAWKVYNCKNRAVAASMGREQLQRARDVGRIFLEAEGASYGKLLKMALEKIPDSKNPDWWDRLMKIAGYEDFITKGKAAAAPTVINVIGQTQRELASEYIEGEEITDDNKGE